jgi:hypothetical protein
VRRACGEDESHAEVLLEKDLLILRSNLRVQLASMCWAVGVSGAEVLLKKASKTNKQVCLQEYAGEDAADSRKNMLTSNIAIRRRLHGTQILQLLCLLDDPKGTNLAPAIETLRLNMDLVLSSTSRGAGAVFDVQLWPDFMCLFLQMAELTAITTTPFMVEIVVAILKELHGHQSTPAGCKQDLVLYLRELAHQEARSKREQEQAWEAEAEKGSKASEIEGGSDSDSAPKRRLKAAALAVRSVERLAYGGGASALGAGEGSAGASGDGSTMISLSPAAAAYRQAGGKEVSVDSKTGEKKVEVEWKKMKELGICSLEGLSMAQEWLKNGFEKSSDKTKAWVEEGPFRKKMIEEYAPVLRRRELVRYLIYGTFVSYFIKREAEKSSQRESILSVNEILLDAVAYSSRLAVKMTQENIVKVRFSNNGSIFKAGAS